MNKSDSLYCKIFLDVEPENIGAMEYVGKIKELLKGLREKSIGVVAACEFEDEL